LFTDIQPPDRNGLMDLERNLAENRNIAGERDGKLQSHRRDGRLLIRSINEVFKLANLGSAVDIEHYGHRGPRQRSRSWHVWQPLRPARQKRANGPLSEGEEALRSGC
jgi:hypothetical protein